MHGARVSFTSLGDEMTEETKAAAMYIDKILD
jgi:hypothetical protein